VFSLPYRQPKNAESMCARRTQYLPRTIAYTQEICNYIYDTYGRFQRTVTRFTTPACGYSFSHLEMVDEQFFGSRLYPRQAHTTPCARPIRPAGSPYEIMGFVHAARRREIMIRAFKSQ